MNESPLSADVAAPLEASQLAGQSLPGEVRLLALEGETEEGWLYRATAPGGDEVEVLVVPANPDGKGPPPSDLVGRVRCRVRRERIEAVARFEHPHVARILTTGVTSEGHPFVVRERSAGAPLSTYLGPPAQLPGAVVLSLGVQSAEALTAAHAAGLVHGNLSPAMLRVTGEGTAAPAVTLLGFTLGPFLQTKDEAVRLGQGYASPEQRFPVAADERSDIYSLGAVLSHALSGVAPSPDGPTEGLPRSARSALATALRERPDLRHPSMHAFADALRRAARSVPGTEASPAEPEPWERPSGASRRRAARIGAGSVAAATLLALGLWLGRGRTEAPAAAPFDPAQPAEVGLASKGGAPSGSRNGGQKTPPLPSRPGGARPGAGAAAPGGPTTRPARPEADFRGVTAGHSWAVLRRPSGPATAVAGATLPPARRTSDPPSWVSPFRRSHPWAASPSGRYYYPSRCRAALQFHDLVFFRSEAEARAQGFVAAPDSTCS